MAKGHCVICETEIEVNICCSGFGCGCMGLPTEVPVAGMSSKVKNWWRALMIVILN